MSQPAEIRGIPALRPDGCLLTIVDLPGSGRLKRWVISTKGNNRRRRARRPIISGSGKPVPVESRGTSVLGDQHRSLRVLGPAYHQSPVRRTPRSKQIAPQLTDVVPAIDIRHPIRGTSNRAPQLWAASQSVAILPFISHAHFLFGV